MNFLSGLSIPGYSSSSPRRFHVLRKSDRENPVCPIDVIMKEVESEVKSEYVSSASLSASQDHVLNVTIVKCSDLKRMEWITKQDPYVSLKYGDEEFRSKTAKGGDENPRIGDSCTFYINKDARELELTVYNSHNIRNHDFIGSGKVRLHEVLLRGYHDFFWPIYTQQHKAAGCVQLILHYQDFSVQFAEKNSPYASSSSPKMEAAAAPGVPFWAMPPPPGAIRYPYPTIDPRLHYTNPAPTSPAADKSHGYTVPSSSSENDSVQTNSHHHHLSPAQLASAMVWPTVHSPRRTQRTSSSSSLYPTTDI